MPAESSCAGCLAAHYCDVACQRGHWEVHKEKCKSSGVYLKNQEVKALKEMLECDERTLGPDAPRTLNRANELGLALQDQGKLSEAEVVFRRIIEAGERTPGRDAPLDLHVAQQPR